MADTITKVKPSIVGIGTYVPTRRPPAQLLGTGFVVKDGRHVVTNYHVVAKKLNEERLERLVVFSGTGARPTISPANMLRSDKVYDLAILKIEKKLPALSLYTGEVREGDEFLFTGFPIGAVLGLYPVTHRSMVSSITPIAIPAPSSQQLSIARVKRLRNPTKVYQLDGTAYPGNSGSPLYDQETGNVVGVINMVHVKSTKEDVLSNPSGISYAIPIKHANNLLRDLK